MTIWLLKTPWKVNFIDLICRFQLFTFILPIVISYISLLLETIIILSSIDSFYKHTYTFLVYFYINALTYIKTTSPLTLYYHDMMWYEVENVNLLNSFSNKSRVSSLSKYRFIEKGKRIEFFSLLLILANHELSLILGRVRTTTFLLQDKLTWVCKKSTW